jgi:hypothetical protein
VERNGEGVICTAGSVHLQRQGRVSDVSLLSFEVVPRFDFDRIFRSLYKFVMRENEVFFQVYRSQTYSTDALLRCDLWFGL